MVRRRGHASRSDPLWSVLVSSKVHMAFDYILVALSRMVLMLCLSIGLLFFSDDEDKSLSLNQIII